MKKKYLMLIISATLVLPVVAQSDQGYLISEQVPIFSAEIPRSELPSAISRSVNVKFDKENPLTWSKFPYTLKEYGWVYEVGASGNMPVRYEVRMRTTSGDFMYGTYSADGNLLETREVSKDIAVPGYILRALMESPYKDWKIVGNKEIINLYHGSNKFMAEQNFKLNLEKDKVRKKLAFNYEASSGKLQARVIR